MNLANLVSAAVTASPDRVAVGDRHGTWTYAQLHAASEALVPLLRRYGVGQGDRVAIFASKSREVIAAFQAVLRLGAAYIPIDPHSPASRMRTIIEDSEIKLLLTDAEHHEGAVTALGDLTNERPGIERLPAADLLASSAPDVCATPGTISPSTSGDLAYILYTSGSTGVPKGVCISHGNALAFVQWAVDTVGVTEKDTLSNHAQFHFDLSVFDIYGAFARGASVLLVPDELSYVGSGIVDFIQRHAISVWYSVPSALVLAIEDGLESTRCPSLRVIIFAGEVFPMRPLRQLRGAFLEAWLFNFYGPTETNVCTYYELPAQLAHDAMSIPIGIPASGAEVSLKSAFGPGPEEEAQPDQSGELLVEGPTVMLGYWGKTPQRGAYATGDLVRRDRDGNLQYLGRRDGMVKIRGFRIELGEVEVAIEKHDAVTSAIACPIGEGPSAKLGVVIECGSADPPSLLELKAWSAALLPRYMILDKLRVVQQIPRTGNGKRDRRQAREFFFEQEPPIVEGKP